MSSDAVDHIVTTDRVALAGPDEVVATRAPNGATTYRQGTRVEPGGTVVGHTGGCQVGVRS